MGEAVAQIFNSFQDHLNNEQELREVRVFSGAVLGENIFALGFWGWGYVEYLCFVVPVDIF